MAQIRILFVDFFAKLVWQFFCGSGWDDGKKTEVMENHGKNSIQKKKKTWKQIGDLLDFFWYVMCFLTYLMELVSLP